jgi:hypothetical protein
VYLKGKKNTSTEYTTFVHYVNGKAFKTLDAYSTFIPFCWGQADQEALDETQDLHLTSSLIVLWKRSLLDSASRT